MQDCGECTLCCLLFPVEHLKKPANTPCVHCNAGCLIHETKESECSDFDCAYRYLKKENIALRPDKCGIVFEKLNDDIMYGTLNPKQDPTDFAKRQIAAFTRQGFSVVLSSINKPNNVFIVSDRHDEAAIRSSFANIVWNRYGNLRN